MKRHVFPIIAATLVLEVFLVGYGPAQEGAAGQVASERAGYGLSAEDRQRIRQRYEVMSEEEREQFSAEMRQRFSRGRGAGALPSAAGAFDRQIERLTAEQDQVVGELTAILDLARKEKATETATAVEALILTERSSSGDSPSGTERTPAG